VAVPILPRSERRQRTLIVAQLVERPIEIVEYKQECAYCADCGGQVLGVLPEDVVPGQDLGVSLQAMLGWMSHYGHLSYAKQQEWLREVGKIEVGIGTLQATTQRGRLSGRTLSQRTTRVGQRTTPSPRR
jgi:hypothetical protein